METFGHYRFVRKLGEGGMGVVYAAEDERLGRTVAVKLIHKGSDATARERLRREARAAASVNHPHICQIYDISEHEGELYIAMELLEGEPLSRRLARGTLPLQESIDLITQVLDALEALHDRSIIHRDLKPSNIFLTSRGVKLLDFGLALPLGDELRLTRPGTISGTPCYMAPEQWAGQKVVPATDLFACGALLFEMLTGVQAFRGDSLAQLCHAVTFDHPPALSGGPEIEHVDRAIHRALAKKPGDRFASSREMAEALRESGSRSEATVRREPVQTVKRLIVLPFRLLKDDAEIDFLTFSLPDAITASLCGLQKLVVRSSRVASRFATGDADPKTLADEANVDVALFGTLMRSGDQVRLKTQLVETPSGTIVWSKTFQAPLGDIFQLEDVLRDGVLESLAIKLTDEEQRRIEGVHAAQGNAYELYLRANQLGFSTISMSKLITARDLYESSIEEDPGFAPAWARLGRIYRIISKYGRGDPVESLRKAEGAFQRALALNADLQIAHSFYTYFEIEELGRAPEAVLRLLGLVRKRIADAEIYAGLVTACRFAGLLDASVVAADRALRLDSTIRTSVHYTYLLNRDLERAIAFDKDEICWVKAHALVDLGRVEEGIAVFRDALVGVEGLEQSLLFLNLAAYEARPEDARRYATQVMNSGFHDPEGFYLVARCLVRAGVDDLALQLFEKAITSNFCCYEMMLRDSIQQRLRDNTEYARMLEEARLRTERARSMFIEAGGPALLS